jgi:hypothetical protein
MLGRGCQKVCPPSAGDLIGADQQRHRMSHPLTIRTLVVGLVLAALAGAGIAVGAMFLFLPAAVQQHRGHVMKILDIQNSSDSVLEAIQSNPEDVKDAIDFDDSVMSAIENDSDRVREAVDDGGPSSADLCSALQASSNPDVNDVAASAC